MLRSPQVHGCLEAANAIVDVISTSLAIERQGRLGFNPTVVAATHSRKCPKTRSAWRVEPVFS
jgi:hypothetical protein